MLRAGIAGFGFMGRMHYRCWKSLKGAEVSAICDVDPDIIARTRQACGNIAGADGDVDFKNIEVYLDFEEMLSAAELDVVSITLPTHLHAKASKTALQAGFHVLCEKPMALDVTQCRRMAAASKKSGKILQIGHCIRFWPEYARAKQLIDEGEYGKVVAATFRRLGSMPDWSANNWLGDDKNSGGMVLDLHIHDTDFVQYLFGMPRAVCSYGAKTAAGSVRHIVSRYLYDDDKAITAEGSWAMMPSFGFQMSFNIVTEKATIVYDSSRRPTFKVCPAEGDSFTPKLEEGDGYSRQIEHFAGLIAGRKLPEIISLKQSMNSIIIARAEMESLQKGEKVPVNPAE